ncbi:Eukaryotic translation initiation factor 2-alpha kinase [Saitoella coloradoensis]
MDGNDTVADPHANSNVVLRDEASGAVVLYDPLARQLSVYQHRAPAPNGPDRALTSPVLAERPPLPQHESFDPFACPYCHRPFEQPQSHRHTGERARQTRESFIDQGYFRLLATSTQNTPTDSQPPTPSATSRRPSFSDEGFNQGYFSRFFTITRELGRGARGVVLLVTHTLMSLNLGSFAVKRIPIGEDHAHLLQVLHEVHLLRRSLRNEYLVQYYHVWMERARVGLGGGIVPVLYVLQEFVGGGDLEQLVLKRNHVMVEETIEEIKARRRRRSKGTITPPHEEELQPNGLELGEILSFFHDILTGLSYLHSHGVIHHDLKPSNILVSLEAHPSGIPKVLISDFGEVQLVGEGRSGTGYTGTQGYRAPEVAVRGGETGTGSDVYSLGRVLHFLIHADPETPRPGRVVPLELERILERLLAEQPEDRPSCQELLDVMEGGVELDIDGSPRERARRGSQVEELSDSPNTSVEERRNLEGKSEEVSALVLRPPMKLVQLDEQSTRQTEPMLPRIADIVRAALFFLKVTSLLYPCSPYTPSSMLAYPLLMLGATDLMLSDTRASIVLSIVHMCILGVAVTFDVICAGR